MTEALVSVKDLVEGLEVASAHQLTVTAGVSTRKKAPDSPARSDWWTGW